MKIIFDLRSKQTETRSQKKESRRYFFIYSVFCLLASVCFLSVLSGCGVTPEDPDYISELKGYVKTDKTEYAVGDPIKVEFRLINPYPDPYEEEVTFTGDDPSIPFQRFSFNTLNTKEMSSHLERTAGDEYGFQGKLNLKANEECVFSTQEFIAPKEGTYKIEVTLFWKYDKKIRFRPATITVLPSHKKEIVTVTSKPAPEIEKAIDLLGSPDWKDQEKATEILVSHGSKAAPFLIPLMAEERRQTAAMRALISMKQEAVPALIQSCSDANWEIRMRSVYALSAIGDSKVVPLLHKIVTEDTDWNVRFTALRFLSESFKDTGLIPLSVQALEDSNSEIRFLANEILTKRTGQDFGFDATAPEEQRKKAIDQWKQWCKEHPGEGSK